MSVAAPGAAVLVLAGVPDQGDMNGTGEAGVDVPQIGGRAVLVAGFVLVTTVCGDALGVGIDPDNSDTAAKLALRFADGRHDDVHTVRVEQINNGIGYRDRQPMQ